MLRTAAVLVFCISSLGHAQTNPLIVTSAASSSTDLSASSLATGSNLSIQTANADFVPWPTSLGGVAVGVQDSGSVTRPAGLHFVACADQLTVDGVTSNTVRVDVQ